MTSSEKASCQAGVHFGTMARRSEAMAASKALLSIEN
jgi:hypothetical protein